MAEVDVVEDLSVALILILLIVSLILPLILTHLAVIFIRFSIVKLMCLGFILAFVHFGYLVIMDVVFFVYPCFVYIEGL